MQHQGSLEGIHSCNICGKQLKTKRQLYNHRRTHKDKVICDICFKYFVNEASKKRHEMEVHCEKKDFNCEKCDRCFARRLTLEEHMNVCGKIQPHNKKPKRPYKAVECSFCGKKFSMKHNLRRHENQQHKIECKNGYMIVSNKLNKKKQRQQKEHICYYCPIAKKFHNKSNFNRHLIMVHKGTSKYISNRQSFIKLAEDQVLERKVYCHICKNQFTCISNLNDHLKISHHIIHVHKCTECDQSFSKRKYMINHKRRMHSQTTYTCLVCDKGFKRNYSLKKHISTHLLKLSKRRKSTDQLKRSQRYKRAKKEATEIQSNITHSNEVRSLVLKYLISANSDIVSKITQINEALTGEVLIFT